MKVTYDLTVDEAHEALRRYLVSRGVLPAHGKVTGIEGESRGAYSSARTLMVEADVEAPPAPEPAEDLVRGKPLPEDGTMPNYPTGGGLSP